MTEPFIITCETCRGRLRVRSADAIGSILACPKCQSLVHITPPEEGDKAAAGPSDAARPESELPEATTGSLLPLKVSLALGCLAVLVTLGVVLGRNGPSEPASGASVQDGSLVHERRQRSANATTEAMKEPGGDSAGTKQPDEGSTRGEAIGEMQEAPPEPATAGLSPPSLPEPMSSDATSDGRHQGSPTIARGGNDVPRVGVPQLDMDLTPNAGTDASDAGRPAGVAGTDPADASPDADVPPMAAVPEPPASSVARMKIQRIDADGEAGPVSDPGQALSLPLAGVSIENATPVELVRLVGDLTGVAFTFTPEAYKALNRVPQGSTSSGSRENTTAGEVLLSVLQGQDLKIEQQGSHAVIVPRPAGGAGKTGSPRQAATSRALQERLHHRITYSFTEATPLAEVLRHIERVTGLTLLVDWEAMASLGLSPSSRVTSSVVDQPLEDVLDGLLPQLGLSWSAVGDEALWVTTRK